MSKLRLIQDFTQAFACAVSSIIDIEVTIVDEKGVRLAGTGAYEKLIGEKVPHNSYFEDIIKSGQVGMIADVKEEFACRTCSNKDGCKELANLAFPIRSRMVTIGLIAIVAFNEKQRQYIIKEQTKLINFLSHMCELMESKIEATESSINLQLQIEDVMGKDYFSDIKSMDPSMASIIELAKKVSLGNSSILIKGESGTGKDVLAKAIHANSDRSKNLLISVNCASIPENLVESELFGYEEGAFTGAKKGGKIGKFELANNSTLFLDEIGDMPLPVQAKLLRVLQDGKIDRIGGRTSIPVDIRLICATHKDLEQMVKKGEFRQDLYYRINVIPITIPPLREREGDISLLVDYYVNYYTAKLRRDKVSVDPEVYEILSGYSWPGNIRELKNIIEYLLNIVDGPVISKIHLPQYFLDKSGSGIKSKTLARMVEDYEKSLYCKYFSGNLSVDDKNRLADELGVSIATVYRKLQRFNIGG